MRRFAEDTNVPVGKSRAEIDELLRQWGAHNINWNDDFENDRISLRFAWKFVSIALTARFDVNLPLESEIKKQSVDGRNGLFSQTKYDKAMAARGRREMRLLLLKIKADLNFVEAGLMKPEEVFVGQLEGKDGRTACQIITQQMVLNDDHLLSEWEPKR